MLKIWSSKKAAITAMSTIALSMVGISAFFIVDSENKYETSAVSGNNTDAKPSNSNQGVDSPEAAAIKKHLKTIIEASHAEMLKNGYTETAYNFSTDKTTISVYVPEGEKTYISLPEFNQNYLVEGKDLLMTTTMNQVLGFNGKEWSDDNDTISVKLDNQYMVTTFTITDGLITKVVQSYDGEKLTEADLVYGVNEKAQEIINIAVPFEPNMEPARVGLTFNEAQAGSYWKGPLPPKGVTLLPINPDGSIPDTSSSVTGDTISPEDTNKPVK